MEFFQYPSSLHVYLPASQRDNKNENKCIEQLGIILKRHRSDTLEASYFRSPLSLLQARKKVTPHHLPVSGSVQDPILVNATNWGTVRTC